MTTTERPTIAYLGADAICLPGLRHLHERCSEICRLGMIITQPDRRQGRGKKLKQNPVAEYASIQQIPLLQPDKPDRDLAQTMVDEGVVLAFVMAYGHFLPKSVREAPARGMLNFHGSILPAYRGASPVETALAMGEEETGVCLMQVVREMDAGAVADCERIPIRDSDTGPELRARVGQAAVPLLTRNLKAALAGALSSSPQDHSAATFCRKISKEDGALDFEQSAREIDRRLRAFTPWPGGYFHYREQTIKVGLAEVNPQSINASPGTIVRVGESLDVATTEGIIRFHVLQRPGGRMLPAEAFLRGFPIEPGDCLPSVKAAPLVR